MVRKVRETVEFGLPQVDVVLVEEDNVSVGVEDDDLTLCDETCKQILEERGLAWRSSPSVR